MVKHALLSPSHSATWIACPNSVLMEKDLIDESSFAAELGTAKHEILNRCLEEDKEAEDFLGERTTNGFLVDKEFSNDVRNILLYIRGIITSRRECGGHITLLFERSFPISHITKEERAYGTVDVTVITDWPDGTSYLDIIDAKFGYIEVEAKGNSQMMMYASSVMEEYDLVHNFEKVSLSIGQPFNCNSVELSAKEVVEWVEKIAAPAAEKAISVLKKGSYEFEDFNITDKGCKWCRAKSKCPAMLKLVSDMTGVELSSESTLYERFEALGAVQDWCKAVTAEVYGRMLSGGSIPGLKLVRGRAPNRTWKDEEEVAFILESASIPQDWIYSISLKSPKQLLDNIEDQELKLKLEEHILKEEGKPCVALESDKRAAITLESPDSGFDFC